MNKKEFTFAKAVRIASGISQAQMAKDCGVCPATVARFEKGKNMRAKTYMPIDMAFTRLMIHSVDGDENFSVKIGSVLSELRHTDRKWVRPKK